MTRSPDRKPARTQVTPTEAPHNIVSGADGSSRRAEAQQMSPASEAALLAGLTAYTDRQTELFGA